MIEELVVAGQAQSRGCQVADIDLGGGRKKDAAGVEDQHCSANGATGPDGGFQQTGDEGRIAGGHLVQDGGMRSGGPVKLEDCALALADAEVVPVNNGGGAGLGNRHQIACPTDDGGAIDDDSADGIGHETWGEQEKSGDGKKRRN